MLDVSFGIVVYGFWIPDSGLWILDCGLWILDCGFWIVDSGFSIWDPGFGSWDPDSGFWPGVLEYGTLNAGFWFLASWDSGFRILNPVFWILDSAF